MAAEKNRSCDVAEIQNYLYRISLFSESIPEIHPDGIYGPRTSQAVAAFQKEYGLQETGEVDRKTFEMIVLAFRHLTETAAESIDICQCTQENLNTQGHTVYFLQIMLRTIQERYSGLPEITVSGSYDTVTSDAVRCIQKLSGYPETGIPDKYTWNNIVRIFRHITAEDISSEH